MRVVAAGSADVARLNFQASRNPQTFLHVPRKQSVPAPGMQARINGRWVLGLALQGSKPRKVLLT